LITCSACGYAVDWLRSCYASVWNLPGAGEVPGRYFWSAEGAPLYPDWHYIGSRNWHAGDGSPWPEFGELETAKQSWRNGALGQILPEAVNVGDGSCIGADLIGPILSPPIGLAMGVDRRCYLVEMPEETHACSFYDPSPVRWTNSWDWTQYENFPAWFNIPSDPPSIGHASACNWQCQYGEDVVGALSFFLRFNSALNLWRFYLARNAAGINFAFRYELGGSSWSNMGPNIMNLVFDGGGIGPLPPTITITAAL